MKIRRNLIPFVAAVGLLATLNGTAAAPKIFGLPNAIGGCEEAGVGSGSYLGVLTVSSFDAKEDSLVANVELTASCQIGGVNRPSVEASGTAAATLLESLPERLVFALDGLAGGKDTSFVIESDLEVVAEKSAKSVVKKVYRNPLMGAAELATVLNKYLGVK